MSIITSLLYCSGLKAAPENNSDPDYILKIGTMGLIPYGWKDGSNNKHGIIYELNHEIGVRLDIPFTNNIYPFKRMLKMLKDGDLDLISSQAHQEAIDSGEKLGVQHAVDVIAGTRKGSNIKSISDLKGKNLIYHLSSSYKELEGLPSTITRVNNYRHSIINLYKDKKMDAAVFSEPAYYYWMKDLGLTKEDFGEVILVKSNKFQWVFVRRNLSDGLKSDIKKVVAEIYNENLYDDLLMKYGKSD
jgi:ABC-type amino acid transport substrate-binding protein